MTEEDRVALEVVGLLSAASGAAERCAIWQREFIGVPAWALVQAWARGASQRDAAEAGRGSAKAAGYKHTEARCLSYCCHVTDQLGESPRNLCDVESGLLAWRWPNGKRVAFRRHASGEDAWLQLKGEALEHAFSNEKPLTGFDLDVACSPGPDSLKLAREFQSFDFSTQGAPPQEPEPKQSTSGHPEFDQGKANLDAFLAKGALRYCACGEEINANGPEWCDACLAKLKPDEEDARFCDCGAEIPEEGPALCESCLGGESKDRVECVPCKVYLVGIGLPADVFHAWPECAPGESLAAARDQAEQERIALSETVHDDGAEGSPEVATPCKLCLRRIEPGCPSLFKDGFWVHEDCSAAVPPAPPLPPEGCKCGHPATEHDDQGCQLCPCVAHRPGVPSGELVNQALHDEVMEDRDLRWAKKADMDDVKKQRNCRTWPSCQLCRKAVIKGALWVKRKGRSARERAHVECVKKVLENA